MVSNQNENKKVYVNITSHNRIFASERVNAIIGIRIGKCAGSAGMGDGAEQTLGPPPLG